MAESKPSWSFLPQDIPKPENDGACDHLKSGDVPFAPLSLPSTSGTRVNIASLVGTTVIFCYPRTGAPNQIVPDSWNEIPGARGCTPQACSFRDLSRDFLELGVSHIFGISTQDTPYQQEVRERIHLPYQLVSDRELELVKAMKLPTFDFEGETLIKRMSMVVEDGVVLQCFYPVFPPDESAKEVLNWLKSRSS